MKKISQSDKYEQKITDYADWRVIPSGLSSLEKRVTEWLERNQSLLPKDKEYKGQILSCLKGIENQIFDKCKIKAEDITEEKVKPLFKDLLNFEIKTQG